MPQIDYDTNSGNRGDESPSDLHRASVPQESSLRSSPFTPGATLEHKYYGPGRIVSEQPRGWLAVDFLWYGRVEIPAFLPRSREIRTVNGIAFASPYKSIPKGASPGPQGLAALTQRRDEAEQVLFGITNLLKSVPEAHPAAVVLQRASDAACEYFYEAEMVVTGAEETGSSSDYFYFYGEWEHDFDKLREWDPFEDV